MVVIAELPWGQVLWMVRERGTRRPTYAAQAQQAITGWEQSAEREGRDLWTRVVLLGDDNASFQGPSPAPQADTVPRLTSEAWPRGTTAPSP